MPKIPGKRPVKTATEKLQEKNAKANRASKKLQGTVGSPFRIKQIVDGKEPAPATAKSSLAAKLKSAPTDTAPHLIVEARAGTGKTTTLIEGLKIVKGLPSSLTPSPQQAAVWDSMALSKGFANSICFAAFNKSIADELRTRVPAGCDAMTMHAMGSRAINAVFGRINVEGKRVETIIAELLRKDIWELRKNQPVLLKAVQDFVGLCKMNLVGGMPEELDSLCNHYEIELNGSRNQIYELVPLVLDRCKDVKKDNCIDFNDMIWIPIVLDLPITRYDLLLIDEAQDLNRCQQALAKRAGKRLILCGDPKQAIYGFAGADSMSMKRMAIELDSQLDVSVTERNNRGCVTLPLTVTRRCGKAIVKEANKIVIDFEAFHTNPEGKITQATLPSYGKTVNEGDMILCRCNAPLVSQCFRFLKEGRKATIQGRDVGQGLISTVKKLMKEPEREMEFSVVTFLGRLSDWLHSEQAKENAKRNPNESKLINLKDRYDCLTCFCEGLAKCTELIAKIESVFTDDRSNKGILLSSGHKAKGLEAKRVFILQLKGASVPHPMAKTVWQREQESNLFYVMQTRAIEELIYVTDGE